MTKRVFWLFGEYEYYPSGGIDDLRQIFDDLQEAKDSIEFKPEVRDLRYTNPNK